MDYMVTVDFQFVFIFFYFLVGNGCWEKNLRYANLFIVKIYSQLSNLLGDLSSNSPWSKPL